MRAADLAEAETALRAAEAYGARVSRAEQAARIADLERDEARRTLDALVASESALTQAKADRREAGERLDSARERAASAATEAEARETELLALATEITTLREAAASAGRRETARAAGLRAAELGKRLESAEIYRAEAEAEAAAVAANPATKPRVAAVEAAEATRAALRRDAAAGAPVLRIDYLGEVRATMDGHAVPGGTDMPVAVPQVLDLPGVARIAVQPGAGYRAASGEREIAGAERALAAALAACGVETVAQARDAGHARDEGETRRRLAASRMDAVAPEGIDRLRSEALAARRDADGAGRGAVPPDDRTVRDIEAALAPLLPREAALRATHAAAAEARARAEAAVSGAAATLSAAEDAAMRAEVQAGPEGTRDTRRTDAASAAAIAQSAATARAADRDALIADAPDLMSAQANMTRASAAARAAQERRAQVSERRAELTATIAAQAESGIEERRDETAGRLAAARDRADRLGAEVAALTRLRDVLDATRTAAREAYFGPVQAELTPLLALLYGPAEVRFDSDTMLPSGLVRGGAGEDIDALSGGTQEQIAILTRLAFARLFARQGRPMPVILDDALVHSDDARIVRMFTALTRVAMAQQILVFSCRQLAFQALGGTGATIEVERV